MPTAKLQISISVLSIIVCKVLCKSDKTRTLIYLAKESSSSFEFQIKASSSYILYLKWSGSSSVLL